MAAKISLFPILNDDLLSKVRYQPSPYEFFYEVDDQKFELQAEEIDGSVNVHKISDENGVWSPDDYHLCVHRNFTLKTYQCLFGKNGIACRNAVLGLALMWTSADSKQRGVIPFGELDYSMQTYQFRMKHEFKKAQLRGNVEFSTILYIKNAGTPLWNEGHLANDYGTILGELDNFIIKLDGNGSTFPIYEVEETDQPLWYVKCDWNDPRYDLFSECVSININKAHKNYKYLDKTKRIYNEQLLSEIMANALCTIITTLKEQDSAEWDATINGRDLRIGSVSEAVYYFANVLGWDIMTPEKMSLSIRKFFDQGMVKK